MTFNGLFAAAIWVMAFLLLLDLLLRFLAAGHSQLIVAPVVILLFFSLFAAMYEFGGGEREGETNRVVAVGRRFARRLRRTSGRPRRRARIR